MNQQMKTKQQIGAEVEQTLRSIDGIERATPRPFFVSRTEARLRQRTAPQPATSWVFRPAYVFASLGLIFLLNVSAVLYVQQQVAQPNRERAGLSLPEEWGFEPNALDW